MKLFFLTGKISICESVVSLNIVRNLQFIVNFLNRIGDRRAETNSISADWIHRPFNLSSL